MKKIREYSDYLKDILDSINKVEQFISGITFDQFTKDDKTIFAVIRALEIIGEATKHIDKHVRRNHPQIPWREMAGIRDKLIHDYIGVDIEVVWRSAIEDLPNLKPKIQDIIDTLG